jgi:NAD(P)-dependent dehydrogenase (short-subunit alcohol dehydrogenase family)
LNGRAGEYVDGSHEYGKVSKINVRATMQIMSICIPFLRFSAHMSKSQTSITVLSASAGEYPWPGHTIFNMNMASLNMLVRCTAVENAAFNIRVNAVAPGYVKNLNMDNARTNEYFDLSLNPDQPV